MSVGSGLSKSNKRAQDQIDQHNVESRREERRDETRGEEKRSREKRGEAWWREKEKKTSHSHHNLALDFYSSTAMLKIL